MILPVWLEASPSQGATLSSAPWAATRRREGRGRRGGRGRAPLRSSVVAVTESEEPWGLWAAGRESI